MFSGVNAQKESQKIQKGVNVAVFQYNFTDARELYFVTK